MSVVWHIYLSVQLTTTLRCQLYLLSNRHHVTPWHPCICALFVVNPHPSSPPTDHVTFSIGVTVKCQTRGAREFIIRRNEWMFDIAYTGMKLSKNNREAVTRPHVSVCVTTSHTSEMNGWEVIVTHWLIGEPMRIVPGSKNRILTAFRHFPHHYCLIMRYN